MKLKTSIIILAGCFGIFLFIMLPIVLSIQDEKEEALQVKKEKEEESKRPSVGIYPRDKKETSSNIESQNLYLAKGTINTTEGLWLIYET